MEAPETTVPSGPPTISARLRDRGLALVRWLLGEIPARVREPDSGTLVVFVAYAAALGMWLGLRFQPKGDPVLTGAWRMLVHGGIPLVAVAIWELRAARKAGAEVSPSAELLTTAGCAAILAPIAARFTDGGLATMTAASFVYMGLPGLVGAALVLAGLRAARRDLTVWGICLGDWRWWLPHHGVLLAALVPVLVLTTYVVEPLAAYYPVNKAARTSLEGFGWAHLGIALDFIGWEFLFRGFLVFAMARRGDALLAILVHAFPFFLLHGNKPNIELVSSFVGGIFAGWFCLRAGSFLPLYVIHLTMMTVVGFTSFLMRNGYL